MAFNIREGLWGIEHLRLALCRKLFKMEPTHFLVSYGEYLEPNKSSDNCFSNESLNYVVSLAKDAKNELKVCERCGFAILRVKFHSAWELEMCSALAVVDLKNKNFKLWLSNLIKNTYLKTDDESILKKKILK